MKFSWCTLFFMAFASFLHAQNVTIPDANFKAALVADGTVNTNGDSEIQLSEAQAAQVVSVVNKGITDLTGIEEFTNIIALFCSNNSIVSADLRNLTKLSALVCSNNQLTSLQIATNNVALTTLNARNNQLTSIDLTNALDSVRTLNLSHNQLTSIDISSLDNDAREVYLQHNQLASIVFPPLIATRIFNCSHNQLSNVTIPVSSSYLDIGNNPMDSLWVSGAVGLSGRIDCDSSQLRHLSITSNYDSLIGYDNLLTDANFFGTDDFSYADLHNNSIDSIRLFGSMIEYLDLSNNQLTRLIIVSSTLDNIFPLDVSNNPNLKCILTDSVDIANAIANWTLDSQTTVSDDCQGIWSSIYTINSLVNVNIYPNPTTDKVQLDLGQLYSEVNYSVHNSLGQRISHNTGKDLYNVEVLLPSAKGIYFVNIQTEKGQAVFKVVKE